MIFGLLQSWGARRGIWQTAEEGSFLRMEAR